MSRPCRNRKRQQGSVPDTDPQIVDSPSAEAWRRIEQRADMNPRKSFASPGGDEPGGISSTSISGLAKGFSANSARLALGSCAPVPGFETFFRNLNPLCSQKPKKWHGQPESDRALGK